MYSVCCPFKSFVKPLGKSAWQHESLECMLHRCIYRLCPCLTLDGTAVPAEHVKNQEMKAGSSNYFYKTQCWCAFSLVSCSFLADDGVNAKMCSRLCWICSILYTFNQIPGECARLKLLCVKCVCACVWGFEPSSIIWLSQKLNFSKLRLFIE